MKVFLSDNKPSLNSHKWASNLSMFNDMVLDCEATDIICENFLSSFNFGELQDLVRIIVSKMRLDSELTIIETDAYLASKKFYVEEINLAELNSILFKSAKKSILNSDHILSILPENINVTHKHYDAAGCGFILKCRRSK
jgi:hypothetical protein